MCGRAWEYRLSGCVSGRHLTILVCCFAAVVFDEDAEDDNDDNDDGDDDDDDEES